MVQVSTPPLSSVLQELTLATLGHTDNGGVGGVDNAQTSNETSTMSAITQSYAGVSTPRTENVNEPSRGEFLIPRPIKTTTTGLRKYKAWCFNTDESDVCLGMLGQGALFCTVKNCRKTHRSNTFHVALPGELYVAKTADTAFVDPVVKMSLLKEDLLERWKSISCTLDEWASLFSLVEANAVDQSQAISISGGVKFSVSDLRIKDQEENTALAFKTPRKRKQMDMLNSTLAIPSFASQINSIDQAINPENNRRDITELDDRTLNLRSALETFLSQFEQERSSSLSYFESSDVKFSKLKLSLGTKPKDLESKFEAPNLWLTLGSVAEEVTKISENYSSEVLTMKNELNQVLTRSEHRVHQDLLPLKQKLNELESFCVESTRKLQANIVTISNKARTVNNPIGNDVNLLQRLDTLEKEMRMVRSSNDSTAIRYGGLGFRSQKESDAWVETTQPSDDYGLIMDFNCVMEHVWTQIVGQKILTNLEKVYKMKLRTNNQAVTLTSFETRIPKFFCGESRSMGVVREGESYFKLIKTWEEWNTPFDGFRDQLKRELVLFDSGHNETISAEVEPLSIYHSLISKTLTDSISWANKLIKFIDDTYREYSRARYGTKKAWHVTTKLAVALMEYISSPRTVVHNSFRVGNHLAVSKTVTYAYLKSLDLMIEIEKLDFRNSPIITSELAKFLALNSNYESIENLQKEVKSLGEGVSKAGKEVTSAVKSVGTVGNNLDKIQKEMGGLTKRIKTLESK